jgi:hypothetical protein
MSIYAYPPSTLRAAAARVAARIREGFVPQVHTSNEHRWARLEDGRLDTAPITPPEGMVLDELVFLAADEQAGAPHLHRMGGKLRHHRHRRGHLPHTHIPQAPQ